MKGTRISATLLAIGLFVGLQMGLATPAHGATQITFNKNTKCGTWTGDTRKGHSFSLRLDRRQYVTITAAKGTFDSDRSYAVSPMGREVFTWEAVAPNVLHYLSYDEGIRSFALFGTAVSKIAFCTKDLETSPSLAVPSAGPGDLPIVGTIGTLPQLVHLYAESRIARISRSEDYSLSLEEEKFHPALYCNLVSDDSVIASEGWVETVGRHGMLVKVTVFSKRSQSKNLFLSFVNGIRSCRPGAEFTGPWQPIKPPYSRSTYIDESQEFVISRPDTATQHVVNGVSVFPWGPDLFVIIETSSGDTDVLGETQTRVTGAIMLPPFDNYLSGYGCWRDLPPIGYRTFIFPLNPGDQVWISTNLTQYVASMFVPGTKKPFTLSESRGTTGVSRSPTFTADRLGEYKLVLQGTFTPTDYPLTTYVCLRSGTGANVTGVTGPLVDMLLKGSWYGTYLGETFYVVNVKILSVNMSDSGIAFEGIETLDCGETRVSGTVAIPDGTIAMNEIATTCKNFNLSGTYSGNFNFADRAILLRWNPTDPGRARGTLQLRKEWSVG